MKTLKDVLEYCRDEIEGLNESLLDNLDPYEEFNENRLFDLHGRIRSYEDIFETIRYALKHHECQYLNDKTGCVFCGEYEPSSSAID